MTNETNHGPSNDIPLRPLRSSQVELAQQAVCSSKYPVPRKLFAMSLDMAESKRLDKPFARWDEDQAKNVARRLACEYDMGSFEAVFVRAARVLWAQHARGDVMPNDDDTRNHRNETVSVKENEKLNAEEIDAVMHEEDLSFWEQPWPLKTTYLMLFVAATVQGWTQTATNGANLGWPTALRLDGNSTTNGTNPSYGNTAANGTDTPYGNATTNGTNILYGVTTCAATPERIWAFAAVNAAPYLAAGVFCLFSDVLINELRFGRRGAIIVSAVCVIIAAVFGSATKETWQFALTRVLLGFGMGCKASVVPVFAAEIAPPHLRGTLVMNWQVFDALGIFLGFTANLIASVAGPAAWRWQVGSSALPAFALFWGTIFVCWDSPRFLMKHEKRYQRQFTKGSFWKSLRKFFLNTRGEPFYRSDAYNTLLLLRGEPILAAKELIYAHCQLLVEKGSRKGAQFKNPMMSSDDFSLEYGSGLRAWTSRFRRLFTEGFIRRELMAAATVMVCQQLCGVNVLIFYSTTLFCQTGNDESTALRPLLLSWGLGLCNVVFAYPAYSWIESKGRRKLVVTTLPLLAILMAIIAAILAEQEPRPANDSTPRFSEGRRDATIFLAYLFTAIYSFGLGPVPFTLSAEMFPLEERMVGMSVAVALNFLGAGCLTLLVPPLTNNPAVLLGPFAALNFVGFIFVWIFVREIARERPVATRQGGADGVVDAHQEKSMKSLTLEGVFKVFEPSVAEHVEFRWKRLTGWQNKETGSFIEYCEAKKQERGRHNADTQERAGVAGQSDL